MSGRGAHQRAKTACPYGHPYDEENTYRYRGHRFCKRCLKRRDQERRERVAAAKARTA